MKKVARLARQRFDEAQRELIRAQVAFGIARDTKRVLRRLLREADLPLEAAGHDLWAAQLTLDYFREAYRQEAKKDA